jgi:NAD-dependent DNA ligase
MPAHALYRDRVADRLVAELLGVCKGLVCEGVVSDGELLGLRRWIGAHPGVQHGYPGSVLTSRLLHVFEDGVISDGERAELSEVLMDLTGETLDHHQPLNRSTRLPLDHPVPTILFDGREHVFTGRMLYGTRSQIARLVTDRGGRVGSTVTRQTDYLVVGPIGSRAWLESTHGTKILRALELRTGGHAVHIVAEDAWIEALEAA